VTNTAIRVLVALMVSGLSGISAIILPFVSYFSCGTSYDNIVWSPLYGFGLFLLGFVHDLRLSRTALSFGLLFWPLIVTILIFMGCYKITEKRIPCIAAVLLFIVTLLLNFPSESIPEGIPLFSRLFNYVF